MLSRVASRTASSASRVAPQAAAAAWSSLRGLAGFAGDDASGADDGTSGEKPAGDETVLGHLLSDETPTDADDDAPHASADHPDDHPAHLDESRGVTVEAGEDLDDDDDDGDLDEDDASVSTTAAELDAALAASALARSSDPIRWYGGVEPHRPPATGRAPEPASFPLDAPAADDVSALDASSIARFWRLSEDDAARLLPEPLPRAIADEFAASNTRRLLFRRCDLDHRVAVAAGKSILLDGGVGAGKSVALAHIVAWARSEGYVVAYVPSGRALTVDSSYQKDEATGAWDTPEHARAVLEWLRAGCGDALAELPSGSGSETGATTLAETVEVGLAAFEKDPTRTVRAALEVIEGLRAASRDGKRKVLFAVDEYNAMFGPTDMHEVLGARKRGNIAAGSTRLLASLRDANAAVAAGCAYVAATSGTIQLSPKLSAALTSAEAPGSEALERVEVKRMNTKEIFSMVRHYAHAKGSLEAVHESVDHEQLAMRIRVLTQGNGKEMREMMSVL